MDSGGFPDSFLARNDSDSLKFRKNFIRTYLERDVPQFGPRIPAETLERLWTMLAHGQGALLNASRLASSLAVSAPTVTSYIDLLVDLLLVRRLRPLHANIGKRLVKSPKIYVRDSGLVHALLGIEDYNELAGHPVVGPSWEDFVSRTCWRLSRPARRRVLPDRGRRGGGSGSGVPGRGEIWAIEIKRGLAARPARGFYNAREDIQPARSFVVYAGEDRYPVTEGVEAMGIFDMVREVSRAGGKK